MPSTTLPSRAELPSALSFLFPVLAVVGATSEDSVSTYNVYNYIDAPYYYHRTDDALKKPVTNSDHIVGGVSPANLSFVTNRAHLEETNDKNAQIRVIDPASMSNFVKSFKELLNR